MDGYTAHESHRYVGDPGASVRDLLVTPEDQLARLKNTGLTAQAEHLRVQLALDGRCLQLSADDLALVEQHFPVFFVSGSYVDAIPEDMLAWIEEINDLRVFKSIGYLVAPDHDDVIVIGTAGPFAETDKPVQYAIAQWGPKIHVIEELRKARPQAIAPIAPQPVSTAAKSGIPALAIIAPQVVTVAFAPVPYLLHGARVGFVYAAIALVVTIIGGLTKRSPRTQELATAALWVMAFMAVITGLGDIFVSIWMIS